MLQRIFTVLLSFATMDAYAALHPSPPTGVATPERPFPGDRIGLPIYDDFGSCSDITFDERVAPTVRKLPGASEYELTYQLRRPAQSICGTPPPSGYEGLFDLGVLPPGLYFFTVRGVLDGEVVIEYRVRNFSVREWDRPGPDVSGIWYPADRPGNGVIVSSNAVFTLFWATQDRDGRPLWLAMSSPVGANLPPRSRSGTAVTTSGVGFAQPGVPVESAWGRVQFEYLRCGVARLAWEPNDPALPAGNTLLTQLLVPDGVPPCDPRPSLRGLPVRFVE